MQTFFNLLSRKRMKQILDAKIQDRANKWNRESQKAVVPDTFHVKCILCRV